MERIKGLNEYVKKIEYGMCSPMSSVSTQRDCC